MLSTKGGPLAQAQISVMCTAILCLAVVFAVSNMLAIGWSGMVHIASEQYRSSVAVSARVRHVYI
jgi:glycine cleavage system pyridoxal-binding protein P